MRYATFAFLLTLPGLSEAEAVSYPREVADYVERRERCEHFRAEPWPEGGSARELERRAFLAQQVGRFCSGSDAALRALKARYKTDRAVMDRLRRYEEKIEGPP